jgi:hypothetical protein
MYARVAHFEGIRAARIDEQVSEMRRQAAAAKAGDLPADAPPQTQTLMGTVTRFIYLVDRESGKGIGISFSETEDDMHRADAAMNEMSPPSDDDGRRTGPAEIYEVALDDSYS